MKHVGRKPRRARLQQIMLRQIPLEDYEVVSEAASERMRDMGRHKPPNANEVLRFALGELARRLRNGGS